jgi:hypothetical protein
MLARTITSSLIALVLSACRSDQFSRPTLTTDASGLLVVSVVNTSGAPIEVRDQPHFILVAASGETRPRLRFRAPVNLETQNPLTSNESVVFKVPSGQVMYSVSPQRLKWIQQGSSAPASALTVAPPGKYNLSVVAFGSQSNELRVNVDATGSVKTSE